MLRISTLKDHQRMSTQELLQTIAHAVAEGETDFHISASGQHDIGGPLWNGDGKQLRFTISNPGQRVGCMCMPNTLVTVMGSAPADAGWLNSGGTVVVRGDAGDTAGHCAAGGSIYIGGRAGTRSGSLMKHDPEHEAPELWILNSTGSFSFEFMGGGRAVVCGHESQTMHSVLGERPCVGMVGGTVYFRGPYSELPDDIQVLPLDDEDIAWLDTGLDKFLDSIARPGLKRELSFWKHWRKLVPDLHAKEKTRMEMVEFHREKWIKGGIFGDILPDDLAVLPLVGTAANRMSMPVWVNGDDCTDCRACLSACPQAAVRRRIQDEKPYYSANADRCIGCGICVAVCPANVWQMRPLPPLDWQKS